MPFWTIANWIRRSEGGSQNSGHRPQGRKKKIPNRPERSQEMRALRSLHVRLELRPEMVLLFWIPHNSHHVLKLSALIMIPQHSFCTIFPPKSYYAHYQLQLFKSILFSIQLYCKCGRFSLLCTQHVWSMLTQDTMLFYWTYRFYIIHIWNLLYAVLVVSI